MADQLDQIDRHILFHLALDARRTSAPDISEQLDVSAATIRNRIKQLEERGVIQGYHANIDYEKTDDKLTYLFICNTDTPRREIFAKEALQVTGVIHVREVMSGRQNLHIEAVGENKQEITRISRDLSNIGLDIEDEALVQRDYHHPYQPFGPDSALSSTVSNLMNLQELAGDAKVIDVTVANTAEAAGLKIHELSDEGLLEDGLLIVAIERDDEVIMPNGGTIIQAGDIVTVLSQHGDAEDLAEFFSGRGRGNDGQSAEERPP
jgi:DNA-binding Lrp family transcriptional regulator